MKSLDTESPSIYDNIYVRKAARQRSNEAVKTAASKALTLEEKIAKLPKWASDHIEEITRQRKTAIDQLNEFTDTQTPSAFSVQEYVTTGEIGKSQFKTKYIQGDSIDIQANGIYLTVRVERDTRRGGLFLSYGSGKRLSSGEAALIPSSYQQFYIKTKENIRD